MDFYFSTKDLPSRQKFFERDKIFSTWQVMMPSATESLHLLQEMHFARDLSTRQRFGKSGSRTVGRPNDMAEIFVSFKIFSIKSGVL